MIKAILFDLDGTLLPGDLNTQLGAYLSRLKAYAEAFVPELAPTLKRDIPEICMELVADKNPNTTVFDKFWSRYCARTGADVEQVEPLFETFYQTDYGRVGEMYTPVPAIAEAIALCRARKWKRIVATNSFYPRSAIEWRLKWAGLAPEAFDDVTSYTNMHFTKPHAEYYREAAALAGTAPEECAMVGNHGAEDMSAGKLGMKTFLLTDFAMEDEGYAGDRGSYQELLAWLQKL